MRPPALQAGPTSGTASPDADAEQDADDAADQRVDGHRGDPFAVPESPLSLLFHAPDLSTVTVPSVRVTAPREEDTEDDTEGPEGSEDSNRRSRRSRRTRSRRGDAVQGGTASEDAEASDEQPPRTVPTTARPSRHAVAAVMRRGDQDLELSGGDDDDPPNTITRVRAPRQSSEPVSDRVTSVRGSTRLGRRSSGVANPATPAAAARSSPRPSSSPAASPWTGR